MPEIGRNIKRPRSTLNIGEIENVKAGISITGLIIFLQRSGIECKSDVLLLFSDLFL